MAIEARRGCGYRKVGGIYIMGGRLEAPCCKLPILFDTCPTCGTGVRLTRTWTWLNPRPWLVGSCARPLDLATGRDLCPGANPEAFGEQVGLLNIGAQFYPTPAVFQVEASTMGISRRVQSVPRNFRLGETWVWLAHPRILEVSQIQFKVFGPGAGNREKLLTTRHSLEDAQSYVRFHGVGRIEEHIRRQWRGGVFGFFRPTSLEQLVTQTQARNTEAMDELRDRGITPVVVPDDDRDHLGSVYDEEDEAMEAA